MLPQKWEKTASSLSTAEPVRWERWGERKREATRDRERTREYMKTWSFPTRWGRSPPARGCVLPAYQRRRWVRERKGFWADLRKGRERGIWNVFGKGRMFLRGCWNILKGKVVFLLFGELSKAGTVGLIERLGSNELQPCNSFGIAWDIDPSQS